MMKRNIAAKNECLKKIIIKIFCFQIFLCSGFTINADDYYSETWFDNHEPSYDISNCTSSTLAWGEAYLQQSYIAMYDATGDIKYLDKIGERSSVILGRVNPVNKGWDMGAPYTTASLINYDSSGQPIMKFTAVNTSYANMTDIKVIEATTPGYYNIVIIPNRESPANKYTFTSMSLDVNASYSIEKRINTEGMIPITSPIGYRSDTSSPTLSQMRVKVELLDRSLTGAIPLYNADGERVSGKVIPYLAPASQPLIADTTTYHAYSGQILVAMLDYAWFVLKRGAYDNSSAEVKNLAVSRANNIIDEAEEILTAANAGWVEGPDAGEGYYKYEKGMSFWCDGVVMPYNYLHAIGSACIRLYQLTNDSQWLLKASRLAKYFKNRLLVVGNCYVWTYWSGEANTGWDRTEDFSLNSPTMWSRFVYEDVSHGKLTVEFVYRCYKYLIKDNTGNVVFDSDDMEKFANTFYYNLLTADKSDVNKRVDGSGGTDITYTAAVGSWVILDEFAPQFGILEIIKDIYESNSFVNVGTGQKALGLSLLIDYSFNNIRGY